MKRFIIPVVFSFIISSCGEVYIKGNGTTVTEQKQVSDFSSVDISAPVNAEITVQPGPASVNLSGDENVLKHVHVSVKDGELVIGVAEGVSIETDQPLKAVITLPQLKSIDLSGAVNAAVKGNLTGDNFDCDLSGSTALTIASLQVQSLHVDISGAGKMDVAGGSAQNASYGVSGSGKIFTYNVQAENVEVDVSGAGTVQTTANKTLDVSISGAGNVTYKGNPAIKEDISGAGSLKAAN